MPSCKPYEREAFAAFMKDLRLRDAYRVFTPEPSVNDYTWHKDLFARRANRGMRIDHMCASSSLFEATAQGPLVTSCTRRVTGTSDHVPLELTLDRFGAREHLDLSLIHI